MKVKNTSTREVCSKKLSQNIILHFRSMFFFWSTFYINVRSTILFS